MSANSRIVFMGTPDFALPALRALLSNTDVVGIVSRPDRPAGRGRSLRPPPVKKIALAHEIPVFQPKSLRTPDAVAQLVAWAPDVIVTAATGHILTAEVLDVPTRGTLNVHASLLPRWRGAAPIQAALLEGDAETGITIMCTDVGLDTGPILSQAAIPVSARETAASLHDKLAQLGADLLLDTLTRWLNGALAPHPQPAEGVTLARQIRKGDGLIVWKRPASIIDRQVRAYNPWPGAYTFWEQHRLKIVSALPLPPLGSEADASYGPPGTVVQINDHPVATTGDGHLQLDKLQVAGKRILSGVEFIRGRPDFVGAGLGAP